MYLLLIFQLDTPVTAKGPVELWLQDLLCVQQNSLHGIIRTAYYQISDPGYQLLNFLNQFPAQVRLQDVDLCVQSGLGVGGEVGCDVKSIKDCLYEEVFIEDTSIRIYSVEGNP